MTVASQSRNRYLDRPTPSSLAGVIDDKVPARAIGLLALILVKVYG
jgi:hypothetical protein